MPRSKTSPGKVAVYLAAVLDARVAALDGATDVEKRGSYNELCEVFVSSAAGDGVIKVMKHMREIFYTDRDWTAHVYAPKLNFARYYKETEDFLQRLDRPLILVNLQPFDEWRDAVMQNWETAEIFELLAALLLLSYRRRCEIVDPRYIFSDGGVADINGKGVQYVVLERAAKRGKQGVVFPIAVEYKDFVGARQRVVDACAPKTSKENIQANAGDLLGPLMLKMRSEKRFFPMLYHFSNDLHLDFNHHSFRKISPAMAVYSFNRAPTLPLMFVQTLLGHRNLQSTAYYHVFQHDATIDTVYDAPPGITGRPDKELDDEVIVQAQAELPVQPAQPVQAELPVQQAQPAQAELPVQQAQPAQAELPVQPAQPVQPDLPVQQAQPTAPQILEPACEQAVPIAESAASEPAINVGDATDANNRKRLSDGTVKTVTVIQNILDMPGLTDVLKIQSDVRTSLTERRMGAELK
ncbi:hypothetical protein JKP88DRAFT_289831 [Tribonema minus]|uniref:Uncharacterized protein n=1 Tax=Tribonema minus TaxID=303371 RepID=A0A835YZM0_9STRA|nr:hypothetical protein JKP88DRAFT_289831 [Tribonema minus]